MTPPPCVFAARTRLLGVHSRLQHSIINSIKSDPYALGLVVWETTLSDMLGGVRLSAPEPGIGHMFFGNFKAAGPPACGGIQKRQWLPVPR